MHEKDKEIIRTQINIIRNDAYLLAELCKRYNMEQIGEIIYNKLSKDLDEISLDILEELYNINKG